MRQAAAHSACAHAPARGTHRQPATEGLLRRKLGSRGVPASDEQAAARLCLALVRSRRSLACGHLPPGSGPRTATRTGQARGARCHPGGRLEDDAGTLALAGRLCRPVLAPARPGTGSRGPAEGRARPAGQAGGRGLGPLVSPGTGLGTTRPVLTDAYADDCQQVAPGHSAPTPQAQLCPVPSPGFPGPPPYGAVVGFFCTCINLKGILR